jgi:hypothetical protein
VIGFGGEECSDYDVGYGVGAIVALHAADFRSALVALGRYKRLTCPELVEVEVEGDEAKVVVRSEGSPIMMGSNWTKKIGHALSATPRTKPGLTPSASEIRVLTRSFPKVCPRNVTRPH